MKQKVNVLLEKTYENVSLALQKTVSQYDDGKIDRVKAYCAIRILERMCIVLNENYSEYDTNPKQLYIDMLDFSLLIRNFTKNYFLQQFHILFFDYVKLNSINIEKEIKENTSIARWLIMSRGLDEFKEENKTSVDTAYLDDKCNVHKQSNEKFLKYMLSSLKNGETNYDCVAWKVDIGIDGITELFAFFTKTLDKNKG